MTTAALVVAIAAATGLVASRWLSELVDTLIAARIDGPPPMAPLRQIAGWTAVGFGVTAAAIGLDWELPAYLFLVALLVVLSFVDLATKTLPRPTVYMALAGGVLLLAPLAIVPGNRDRLLWAVIGALAGCSVLAVLHFVLRGGLGWGDVRLGAVLGWYVGWQGLRYVPVAITLAFVLSAAVSIALLATRRIGRRSTIPFGPFLAAGAMITIIALAPTGA